MLHWHQGAVPGRDAGQHQPAQDHGGHDLDQFKYAERATGWRANHNSIGAASFTQMQRETHPCPAWIVASVGTGGALACGDGAHDAHSCVSSAGLEAQGLRCASAQQALQRLWATG